MEEARIGVLKTCFESYTSIQVRNRLVFAAPCDLHWH